MGKKKVVPEGLVPVVIEGRTFVLQTDPSFGQDMYMHDLVNRMGLDEIDVTRFKDGRLDHEVKKLVIESYRTGDMFNLLGAVLVEKGKELEWTEETAEENGELFKKARGEAKQILERDAAFLLLSFFTEGLSSMKTSPSFSLESAGNEETPSTEEPSISETGKSLSAKSREVIRLADEKSRSGRSAKDS